MPHATRLLLALALAACLAGAHAAGRRLVAEPEAEADGGAGSKDVCPAGYSGLAQEDVPEELVDATLAEFFGSGLAANETTFAPCASGTSWTIKTGVCAKEGEALVGIIMGCGSDEVALLLLATVNTAGAAPEVASLKAVKPDDLQDSEFSANGVTIGTGSALWASAASFFARLFGSVLVGAGAGALSGSLG